MKNKTLILIPAYNEESNLEEVIRSVINLSDVCIINDGSTDSTLEIIKKLQIKFPNLHCLTNETNLHIQKSILKGFEFGVENDYQSIITMDAGNSHGPEDVKSLIELESDELVISNRKTKEGTPLYRKFLSFLANICFSLLTLVFHHKMFWIDDATSGLRRYPIKVVSFLTEQRFFSHSFGFHFEALWHSLVFTKLSHKTLPITYKNTNSSINFAAVMDGGRTFLKLFAQYLNWKFICVWFLIILFNYFFISYFSKYPIDDALIHFRIARNFIHHGLPYFNISDAVLSSSSHFYVIINSLLFLVFGAALKVNILFQFFLSIAFIEILYRVLKSFKLSGIKFLIMAFLTFFVFLSYLSAGLMELTLASTLLLYFVYYAQNDKYLTAGVFLALLIMTRNEYIILAILSIATLRSVKLYFSFITTLIPFATYLFFYYRTIIPQAFFAKSMWGPTSTYSKIVDFFSWEASLGKFLVPANEYMHTSEASILKMVFPVLIFALVLFIILVFKHVWKNRNQKLNICLLGSSLTLLGVYLFSPNQISFWYWPIVFIPLTVFTFSIGKSNKILIGLFLLIISPRLISSFQSLSFVLPKKEGEEIIYHTNYERLNSRHYTYKNIARSLLFDSPADLNVLSPEVGTLGWYYPKEIWGAFGLINTKVFHNLKNMGELERNKLILNNRVLLEKEKPRFLVYHPYLLPDLYLENQYAPTANKLRFYKNKQTFKLISPLLGLDNLLFMERVSKSKRKDPRNHFLYSPKK